MKKGFTLAEVLMTLAIIGVIAALTVPSVIVNTQQKEFKTGLKKAVSVLNQALVMTQAMEDLTPYDIHMQIDDMTRYQRIALGIDDLSYLKTKGLSLYSVLTQHMNLIKTTGTVVNIKDADGNDDAEYSNIAFYTADGMRFEIPIVAPQDKILKLHEAQTRIKNNLGEEEEISIYVALNQRLSGLGGAGESGRCGSYGLANNPRQTRSTPCIIMVDVNGDRKPNPSNYQINENGAMEHAPYTFPTPDDKRINDIFAIMITDSKAIPYGVVAQRAMYQASDKK